MDLNIAVVDDLEIDCERIEKCTQQYFLDQHKTADVVRYYNAEDFLKAYRKGEYQIMFLDVIMDEMNGLELAKRLRNGDRNRFALEILPASATSVIDTCSMPRSAKSL